MNYGILKLLGSISASVVCLVALSGNAWSQAAIAVKPVKAVELHDPASKEVVGWYDPAKKTLVFPKRNMAIPRSQVNRVSAKDREVLDKQRQASERQTLKYMQPPPRMQTVTGRLADTTVICEGVVIDGNVPSGAIGGGEPSGNCVGLCWLMAEGGASCRGCCAPIGKDACYCWESCSDSMSSIAK